MNEEQDRSGNGVHGEASTDGELSRALEAYLSAVERMGDAVAHSR